MRLRRAAIVVHRWAGLVMAAFLCVAGLTGAALAFFADLDAAWNPGLFRASPPTRDAPLLDPFELRDRVLRQLPHAALPDVILDVRPGRTLNYWIDDRETFVDPYTGNILGSRKFGDITEGSKNLLTFVYRLHYSLALGDVGTWIFGGVALLWFIDCFVGAYLTLPLRRTRKPGTPRKAWLRRWAPSWLLRAGKLFSLVFTWHRASGLWVWGALLVFAWSGVALNLGDQVYKPVMKVVLGAEREHEQRPLSEPRPHPLLAPRAARDVGRRLMAAEAARRGFTLIGERWLAYDDKRGAYRYTVESTLDIAERLAETTVAFDGDDGRPLAFHAPTGHSARGTVDSWLIALHFGAVRELGVAYRAFVSVLGVGVVLLSVTGVWIWWHKRRPRIAKGD